MSTQGGDRFNAIVLDLVDLALQQAFPGDVFSHMKGFCEASLANTREPKAIVADEANHTARLSSTPHRTSFGKQDSEGAPSAVQARIIAPCSQIQFHSSSTKRPIDAAEEDSTQAVADIKRRRRENFPTLRMHGFDDLTPESTIVQVCLDLGEDKKEEAKIYQALCSLVKAFGEEGLQRARKFLVASRGKGSPGLADSSRDIANSDDMSHGLQLYRNIENTDRSRASDPVYGIIYSAEFVTWFNRMKEDAKKKGSATQQRIIDSGLKPVNGRGWTTLFVDLFIAMRYNLDPMDNKAQRFVALRTQLTRRLLGLQILAIFRKYFDLAIFILLDPRSLKRISYLKEMGGFWKGRLEPLEKFLAVDLSPMQEMKQATSRLQHHCLAPILRGDQPHVLQFEHQPAGAVETPFPQLFTPEVGEWSCLQRALPAIEDVGISDGVGSSSMYEVHEGQPTFPAPLEGFNGAEGFEHPANTSKISFLRALKHGVASQ
ncbi:MAG: hypothetical protein Q9207_006629 [Kuettlingeria erythrocarpa]